MQEFFEKHLGNQRNRAKKREIVVDIPISRIPVYLLPFCHVLMTILVIYSFVQTEKLFSTSRQIIIALLTSISVLLHLGFFYCFNNIEKSANKGKLKLLFSFTTKIIYALSLSYTFIEGQITNSKASYEFLEVQSFIQLSSQLLCIYYLLGLKILFYYTGSVKSKIWLRSIFLAFWLLYEILSKVKLMSSSGNFIIIACLLFLVVISIIYGACQVSENKSETCSRKVNSLIIDHLDQSILILNTKRELVQFNQLARRKFGLNNKNNEKFISTLLTQRLNTLAKEDEIKENDFKILREDRSQTRRKTVRKNVLPTHTIIDLLDNSQNDSSVCSRTYFIDWHFVENLEGDHVIGISKGNGRVTETEDGLLADDFHFFESNKIKLTFKFKLLRVKLDEFEGDMNALFVLLFDDLQEAKAIIDHSEGEKMKKNLLKSFSHEMHTALNGSISMIDCALEDPIVTSEIKDKYLNQTQISLKTLKYFITDVIDYLKLETHELVIEREVVDMNETVQEILHLMKIRCEAKGLVLITNNIHLEEEIIYTDPLKLKQVLLNLLSTSLKYTFFGHINLEIRESLKYKGCIEFEVEDTRFLNNEESSPQKLKLIEDEEEREFRAYIGKKLARILSPDHLKDTVRTECRSGKGVSYMFLLERLSSNVQNSLTPANDLHYSLGSKVFKKTVTKSLFLPNTENVNENEENNENLSSIFEVEDELALSPLGPIKNMILKENSLYTLNSQKSCNNESIMTNTVNNHKKEVLIVDDDPFNILSMELILKREDYICHRAFNGLQALEFLQKYYSELAKNSTGLQLIFMDLNMPEMDGLACSRVIITLINQFKLPYIPIICCSANDAQSDVEACKAAGMSGFISKPVTINKIRQIVKSLFEE